MSPSKSNFAVNTLPSFSTIEEERRHRKERLAGALRLFALFGFDEGAAGHITARDPEWPDRFWVNPFGRYFGRIKVSDLLLVTWDGKILAGDGPLNKAALAIHRAIYQARPDVMAAAHAHSVHGKAWSTLGRLLDPITQDACVFYEDHALFDDFTGAVLDEEEGLRIARTLGNNKALILRNHGLLTVGQSVDEAAWWFITMDRSCQAQLLAEAAGKPILINPQYARETRDLYGNPLAGWNGFQPLWEQIVSQQPDLLE
ncbi:MAG: class II aldolase/adducin family protein [Kyrpidia sp.]|nr:class II aldolase/adducin family protein [Kyrpidia sp.]